MLALVIKVIKHHIAYSYKMFLLGNYLLIITQT